MYSLWHSKSSSDTAWKGKINNWRKNHTQFSKFVPSGTKDLSSILVGTAPGQQHTEGAEGALQPFPNQFQPLQPGKGPGSAGECRSGDQMLDLL